MERLPHVHAFIDNYLSCARSVELFFRIPVSVTLAYAAIDSDWGTSSLAKEGIVFGQPLKHENMEGLGAVKVTHLINRKETIQYFKKLTVREAFLAYGEKLQVNPLFEEAHKYVDNPEKFLEIIAAGFQNVSEKTKAQLARVTLKEHKLKDFDSWLYVDLKTNQLNKI